MAWSELNSALAEKITALLDECADLYPTSIERFYSRAQAEAIIHAALWGYAVRCDSTAGAYAAHHLFDALGLEDWTFKKGRGSDPPAG